MYIEETQGRKTHPQKSPTQINPTENSLRKQFAQTVSACLLFNLEEIGRTVCTNSPKNCLRKLFLFSVPQKGPENRCRAKIIKNIFDTF